MSPILLYAVGLVGVWMLQDGLASIWWYRKTENFDNHAWRLARIIGGIFLVIVAGLAICR